MAWFDLLYGSDGRVPFQHRGQRLGTDIGDLVARKAGKGGKIKRRRKKERKEEGKKEKGEKGTGNNENED